MSTALPMVYLGRYGYRAQCRGNTLAAPIRRSCPRREKNARSWQQTAALIRRVVFSGIISRSDSSVRAFARFPIGCREHAHPETLAQPFSTSGTRPNQDGRALLKKILCY